MTGRHLPGKHDQKTHGNKGVGKKVKKVIKTGQAALDAAPAKMLDNGYGIKHPLFEPGKISWSSADPGWDEEQQAHRVRALQNYRGTDYVPMNRSLRGLKFEPRYTDEVEEGDSAFRKRIKAQLQAVDDVMAQSRLTSDVRVVRGTKTGRGVFGDALAGDLSGFEWTEDAYVSTTVSPKVADWFGDTGLIMTIRVPKGTGAVNMSPMKRGEEDDEAELLLQRGLKMRVVSDTGPGLPRHLEVEVVHGD